MIPKEELRTGILVHGCNLHAENWRHLVWGQAPGMMGRVPQALLSAVLLDAAVVVFGTGASRKRYHFPGSPDTGKMLLEAEYTKAFLDGHFDELLSFKAWSDYCPVDNQADWDSLKRHLSQNIRLDIESDDTRGELERAGEIFLEHDCNRVVLVSSPTHLVRVLRDAACVYRTDRRFERFQDNLSAMPSATSYEGFDASDVVVVEPPHRPDRHAIPTHRRIARMLSLQNLDEESLLEFIGEFDELLQRFEDRLSVGPPPLVNTWPTQATVRTPS